jgi:hypothetical protein
MPTLTCALAAGIPAGSSGSWIISHDALSYPCLPADENTARTICVHGMFVADDELGDIYMVPLADILDDARDVLQISSVRLPNNIHEIRTLFEPGCLKLKTIPDIDPAGPSVPMLSSSIAETGSNNAANFLQAESRGKESEPPVFSYHDTTEYRWKYSECHADNSFDIDVG